MAGVKRKTPSAAEVAEAPAPAITPTVITNEILQNRLLAGLGIKGGARGSLTRCVARLQDEDAAAADALVRELEHSQIEITKLLLTLQKNQMELRVVQKDTEKFHEQTETERAVVEGKRTELKQQLEVTACEREYDALAKLCANRHPTSRRVLQQQLDAVTEQCKQTKGELQTSKAQVEVRQAQFQLLMQCILDLKQSLTEPLYVKIQEKDADESEQEEGQADETEDMDVDTTERKNEEDLYDDLE